MVNAEVTPGIKGNPAMETMAFGFIPYRGFYRGGYWRSGRFGFYRNRRGFPGLADYPFVIFQV